MKNVILIFTLFVSFFIISNPGYSQGSLEELTADQAKIMSEAVERGERERQLNSILSVLIPVIIGALIIGFVIIKRKKKGLK